MSIKRVWHGWTTKENADKYQALLKHWDQEAEHYELLETRNYEKI